MNFKLVEINLPFPKRSAKMIDGSEERKCWMARVRASSETQGQSVGRKGATKVFKHGPKSPWVPTLTGPFLNGEANIRKDLRRCCLPIGHNL